MSPSEQSPSSFTSSNYFLRVSNPDNLISATRHAAYVYSTPRTLYHGQVNLSFPFDAQPWFERHLHAPGNMADMTSQSEGCTIYKISNCIIDIQLGMVLLEADQLRILHASHHVASQAHSIICANNRSVADYQAYVAESIAKPIPSLNEHLIFLLNTKWSAHNYYHWLQEALPRIDISKNRLGLPCRYLWIAPCQPQRFHLQSFELADITPQLIVSHNRFFRVSNLLWPSFFNANSSSRYSFSWFETSKTSHLRPTPKKLFIDRSQGTARSISNMSDLIPILEKYYYTVIDFGLLSCSEQHHYFSRASHIVGAHGAGLTNIMSSNNAKILEICPFESLNHCFYAISNASSSHLNYNQYYLFPVPYADRTKQLLYIDPLQLDDYLWRLELE